MRERGGVQSHEMFDPQKPSHCLFPGFSSILKLKLSFDFFFLVHWFALISSFIQFNHIMK